MFLVALKADFFFTACLNALGMGNGLFTDSSIQASSITSGHEAKQGRAPKVDGECLASSSDTGTGYRGYISRTVSGIDCQPWKSQSPHNHQL